MKHQKILNLLNILNLVIQNSWQENWTLSIINEIKIMVYEIKLSIIQKFYNLIFGITMTLSFS